MPNSSIIINASESNGEMLKNYVSDISKIEAEQIDEEKIKKEEKANKQYEKIMKEYSRVSKSSELDDIYGGSYIDELGELVILVTDKSKKNIMSGILGSNEDATYLEVKNSYSKLLSVKETIEEKYKDNYRDHNNDMLESIREVYIDDMNNSVVVCMAAMSDDKIKAFKKTISNEESISFEQIDELTNETTTLKTGQEIKIDVSGTYYLYSIGFRAYKSTSAGTIYGFVTSAHSNSVGDDVYDPSGNLIGVVEDREYSGDVDAAFVEITEDYDVSNTIKYSDSSGGTTGADTISGSYYITSIATGSTVYKCGRSTYLTSGSVKSSSSSWTVNGNTFTDLVKCDYNSAGGDSGGVVYTYYNGGHKLLGVHKGSSSFLLWRSSYAVQADNIISTIGVMLH